MWVELGKYHTGTKTFFECTYDIESFKANAFGPLPHKPFDMKTIAYSVTAETEDNARTKLEDMIGPGIWE